MIANKTICVDYPSTLIPLWYISTEVSQLDFDMSFIL